MNARAVEILEIKDGPTNKIPTASPVTVTTASTVIVLANTKRKHVLLQNNGTEPCIIRLSDDNALKPASTTAYNFVLSDGTVARDGLGASVTIENYQGQIVGIVEANTTTISVMEIK